MQSPLTAVAFLSKQLKQYDSVVTQLTQGSYLHF